MCTKLCLFYTRRKWQVTIRVLLITLELWLNRFSVNLFRFRASKSIFSIFSLYRRPVVRKYKKIYFCGVFFLFLSLSRSLPFSHFSLKNWGSPQMKLDWRESVHNKNNQPTYSLFIIKLFFSVSLIFQYRTISALECSILSFFFLYFVSFFSNFCLSSKKHRFNICKNFLFVLLRFSLYLEFYFLLRKKNRRFLLVWYGVCGGERVRLWESGVCGRRVCVCVLSKWVSHLSEKQKELFTSKFSSF